MPKFIRRLILIKSRLWKKVKGDEPTTLVYRAAYTSVKMAKRSYVSKHEHDLIANPNQMAFFKYINRTLGRSRQPIQLFDSLGNTVSKGPQTAEAFSNEFSKNFSTSIADYTITHALNCSSTISLFNASYSDIVTALLASSNSAAGPDRISGSSLRKLAPVLGQPVSIIFQQSIAQGQFPQQWKPALVVPIYKGKCNRASASLYRPVSLCSVFVKALEKSCVIKSSK